MKILFLPNWKVHRLTEDSAEFQPPDKKVEGKPYWFFRHFMNACDVTVSDISYFFHKIEKRILKAHAWQSIKAFVCENRYDLVISHGAPSALLLSFLNSRFNKNIPQLIIDVGCMNSGRENPTEIRLIRKCLKSRPYIIYHSSIQSSYYQKFFPELKMRYQYIPLGADDDYFNGGKLPDAGEYILSFGYQWRDYETLLAAWRLVKTDLPLKIVGVKKSARFDDLPPGVEMIRRLPINELKEMISGAYLVVIPLPVFNFSYGQMSILQSMSMAKTVIATRTPSTIDYYPGKLADLLVKSGDKFDLAEKIMGLCLNKKENLLYARLCKENIRQVFNERNMARNIEEYIYSFI